MTRRSDGAFIGVGGLRLAWRSWEAARARAALVVVHGLGEHSGRYAEFGMRMAGCGISTWAMDLRGHGRSEGRRGHVPAFDIFLQELDLFRREVEGLADTRASSSAAHRMPMFLLGHSMGGLVALRYLEEYAARFDGAIITSPWLATAMPVPRWKITLAGALDRVLPALPFRSNLDPALLSHVPAIVAAYRDDPLVHSRITPRMFVELSAAMDLAHQRSDRIREPLLFLLAGDDRIVSTDRTLRLAPAITAPDVTIRVLPGLYHEVLNEYDRADTYRVIRDWITADDRPCL